MANSSRYTYVTFGNEVVELTAAALVAKLIDAAQAERMVGKAQALIGTQEKKAAYNATNPKKSAPKGASEETKRKANAIAAVLSTTPMTTAEINAAAGTNFNALEVSNAIRFIDNVTKGKVVRNVVSPKGLKAQKEYTAYFFTEAEGGDGGEDAAE